MVSLTRWRRNFSSNFAFFLSPSRWKICFYYFYINFHPRMLWIGEQAGDQRFTWPRSGARVCFQVCELLMPFECFVNFSLNKLFFFVLARKLKLILWMESENRTMTESSRVTYADGTSEFFCCFFFVQLSTRTFTARKMRLDLGNIHKVSLFGHWAHINYSRPQTTAFIPIPTVISIQLWATAQISREKRVMR